MQPLTRNEVREIDRWAIEELGLPGLILMENAGRNASMLLHERFSGSRVSVVCGKGNNAGDGLVIARHLWNLDYDIRILLAYPPEDFSSDVAIHWNVTKKLGIPWVLMNEAPLEIWKQELKETECIVDALLGTGAIGSPRGASKTAIQAINFFPSVNQVDIFAVDIPSGLDCDTGKCGDACIKADVTGTFVAQKIGFLNPKACHWTGEVQVLDIGVPIQRARVHLERI
ncbi:MAG: NAD(P)H-hydrate epimerase [Pirellulales bacterium]